MSASRPRARAALRPAGRLPVPVAAVLVLVAAPTVAGCGDGGGGSAGGVGGGPGASRASPPPSVPVPGREGAVKSAAAVRAERRAYDGAPPVIPHTNFGMDCTACHSERGMAVPGVGFAPPMPHEKTPGISGLSRCTQCHVFRTTDAVFRGNGFEGLRQDLRRGRRLHDFAPPVLPHPLFLRENCSACHDGPAAREEIRTPHPERLRCTQCHVPRTLTEEWSR